MRILIGLVLGVLGLQVALYALTRDPIPARDAWVRERAAALQPTEAERRWEQIGWVHSLSQALSLGRKHQRPIYLFAILGRMELSRN